MECSSLRDPSFGAGAHSSGRVSLNDLPDVALTRCFSFFGVRELSLNIAPVCSRWHRLSRDPTLWTSVDDENLGYLAEVDSALKLFRTAPIQQLKHLHLPRLHSVDRILRIVAERCSNLQTLHLYGSAGITAEVLAKVGKTSPGLSNLHVVGTHFKDKRTDWLLSFSNLKKLSAPFGHERNRAPTIDRESWDHLLKNGDKLEYLSIPGHINVPEGALSTFLEKQKALNTLQTLHINGDHLSPRFYLAVGGCSKLRSLTIDPAKQITVPGGIKISQLQLLVQLGLCHTGTNLTEDCLLEMFTKPNFQHLERLSLIGCFTFSDNAALALSQCCGEKLTMLNLQDCPRLTRKGLENISSNCPRLVALCGQ